MYFTEFAPPMIKMESDRTEDQADEAEVQSHLARLQQEDAESRINAHSSLVGREIQWHDRLQVIKRRGTTSTINKVTDAWGKSKDKLKWIVPWPFPLRRRRKHEHPEVDGHNCDCHQ